MNRFWEKVEKTEDCWNWIAGKHRDGYGFFMYEGRPTLAHRVVLLLDGVDIPSGMCVCHTCDNPGCVNPDHLWIGTHAQNMADRDIKGRQARGINHCDAKLTEDDVREIRRLRGKFTTRQLANMFGIDNGGISKIHNRKIWKHVH